MNYGRATVERALHELGLEIGSENQKGWASSLCPLHEDSKPSFMIHLREGAWRCLSGCGGSPDLAVLIERVSGEPRLEAQRRLLLGMTDDPEALQDAFTDTASEFDVLTEPESLWYDQHQVPQYILDRGFTLTTCKRWQIGYDQELPAAVIPVRRDGELIGLIRRRITAGEPKYLYSWGLPKEAILFGLDQVAAKWRKVIVVEGSLDCIWLEQYGYPAVAILGSVMSELQAQLLRERFYEVVLAFDNDHAGHEATERARRLLRGLDLRTVQLPNEMKDVQECSAPLLSAIFTRSRAGWYGALQTRQVDRAAMGDGEHGDGVRTRKNFRRGSAVDGRGDVPGPSGAADQPGGASTVPTGT